MNDNCNKPQLCLSRLSHLLHSLDLHRLRILAILPGTKTRVERLDVECLRVQSVCRRDLFERQRSGIAMSLPLLPEYLAVTLNNCARERHLVLAGSDLALLSRPRSILSTRS
jgi:hypothetical protein